MVGRPIPLRRNHRRTDFGSVKFFRVFEEPSNKPAGVSIMVMLVPFAGR